jgi:hypothetical protein
VIASFEDEWGHDTKNTDSLKKQDKTGEQIFLLDPLEGT